MPDVPPQLPCTVEPAGRASWRHLLGAALLTAYVLRSLLPNRDTRPSGPILAPEPSLLLLQLGIEAAVFAIFLALACLIAKPPRAALYLATPPSWWTPALALLWSGALRFGVGLVLAPVLVLTRLLSGPDTSPGEAAAMFRPKVENLFPVEALSQPLYLFLMLTVVSFVFAGLREELWRAGLIAMLLPFLRRHMSQRRAEWTALSGAAVIFGLAHLPQGAGGMLATGVLGVGLGAILVFRRSLLEATLAHGFFNATSFVFLAVLSNRRLLERLGIDPSLVDPLLGR